MRPRSPHASGKKKSPNAMKKIMLLLACGALFAACENGQKAQSLQQATEDSLQNVIDQKDQDLNDLMGALQEINEGFNQINEAEGRVNTLNQHVEEGNAKANIMENMKFIQTTLEQSRQKIAELQKKVSESATASDKLKDMVNQLTEQLNQKTKDIEELRAKLAERDIRIEELDKSVSDLTEENAKVKEESEQNARIAHNQDQQLNTAWYVYGTARELKDHKILESGDVLQSRDFDRDYFTKIDIRKTNVIPLGSKWAKVLTNHPESSYTLLKDTNGEYTLRITDAYKFWSVSKYLVIRVK